MKFKIHNIFLLVALMFIWGGVIYKYIIPVKDNSMKNYEILPEIKDVDNRMGISKDSFELLILEKDPFGVSKLDKTPIVKSMPNKIFAQSNELPSARSRKEWPSIKYYGFVKTEQTKQKLIVLSVNGKLFREREKNEINGLRLLKASEDSLFVFFDKTSKAFAKI